VDDSDRPRPAAIEVQTAVRGPRGAILEQTCARKPVEQHGEGWYFGHGGSNWGFRCNILAHLRKGYGVVVMTNGDNGWPLIEKLVSRVAAACGWDMLDKPIPR